MDISRRAFPLSSLKPTRQKQRIISQQNTQPANAARQIRQVNGGSADSQIANLKQCISAYLDSIQMVCRAGSWLAETFSFLLNESPSGATAFDMKSKFSKMLEASISTTMQAKNNLSSILLDISIPDLNCNNQSQAIEECRQINTKVLEKCIYCLSEVHNSFFKFELDVKVNVQSNGPFQQSEETSKTSETQEDSDNRQAEANYYSAEWERLVDTTCNTKSWLALKQRNMCLRKYNGLTGNEIQNLLKHGTVSDLYLEKLNQRIDMALRNYEVGLRAIPNEYTIVLGGFHCDTNKAKTALLGCCSQSEMEQGTQRLPVSQFLHCELPLMTVTINRRDYLTDTKNSLANVNQKKNAVRQLLQSTNQKLSISETDDLASEILGDVCPARWRNHVKAALQLLYGNSGLIIMDTVSGESNNAKRNAVISMKDNFVVVSITSTWCLKEDPGTMSLLQRNLDPEKSLATIHVRYVSVFHVKASPSKRFEPGIFVETFVQTGSENRRRASQTLRATQTVSGVPLTPLSTCWLIQQPPIGNESPVLSTRIVTLSDSTENKNHKNELSASTMPAKSEDSDGKSERKRKKKLVVEIKEGDTSSDDDKSSDIDDSVKDVIHMLSGSSRSTARRRHAIRAEKKKTEQDTDELSKATEDILDASALEIEERIDSPAKGSNKVPDGISGNLGDVRLPTTSAEPRASLYSDVAPSQSPYSQPPSMQQPKSHTLPGAIGRKPFENPDLLSKPSSNTLPMHTRDMLWGMPFAQRSPQHLPMSSLVMPSGMNQASPTPFRAPFFPPASTPPFSGPSPSISPRPSYNLNQSIQMNQYNTWSHSKSYGSLSSVSQLGSDIDVGDVLQGVKNLSMNPNMTASPMHNNSSGFQNQLGLLHAQNQHHDKVLASGPNLNNNNLTSGSRGSRSLPHPALHHYGDLSRPLTNDMKQHNFPNSMSPMRFQSQFHLKESEVEDARGTNVGNAVGDHSKKSFGPVGSPVIGRQRKDQDLPLQQQSSNTWPFVAEYSAHDSERATAADKDYQNYIAAVTQRAALRKPMQDPNSQPFDPTDVAAWNSSILWENQCLNQPSQDPGLFTNSASRASVDGNGNILSALSDIPTDPTKSGTWPWQLWPSPTNDNAGIWNWGNDSMTGNNRNIQ